jgi:hypothetical protein
VKLQIHPCEANAFCKFEKEELFLHHQAFQHIKSARHFQKLQVIINLPINSPSLLKRIEVDVF